MLKKLTCLFLLLITLLLITAGPFHVSGDFVGIITGGIDGSKDIYFTPYSRFKHAFTPKTN